MIGKTGGVRPSNADAFGPAVKKLTENLPSKNLGEIQREAKAALALRANPKGEVITPTLPSVDILGEDLQAALNSGDNARVTAVLGKFQTALGLADQEAQVALLSALSLV